MAARRRSPGYLRVVITSPSQLYRRKIFRAAATYYISETIHLLGGCRIFVETTKSPSGLHFKEKSPRALDLRLAEMSRMLIYSGNPSRPRCDSNNRCVVEILHHRTILPPETYRELGKADTSTRCRIFGEMPIAPPDLHFKHRLRRCGIRDATNF